MKIQSMPKELLAEVLDYLADYERLNGLDHLLEGEFTVLDVRAALREMALFLRRQVDEEKGGKGLMDLRKNERLSPRVRNLLSILSPTDERRLLLRFGLLD